MKNPYPIKLGDESDLVRDVQIRLAVLGSKVHATGKFNIGTLSAVKSWQKKNKLKVSAKLTEIQYKKLVAMTDPLMKPAPVKKKSVRKKKI
ncbi:MAG: peptidoglycan-binding domain-containing protein [Oribacterium sp.]|nr:peptidoglycan-binding domain-containing protein [Oribacterium sp.]